MNDTWGVLLKDSKGKLKEEIKKAQDEGKKVFITQRKKKK